MFSDDMIQNTDTATANNMETAVHPTTADIAEQQDPERNRIAQMFVSAEAVEYAPPKWLIEPYFQLGKGTLIQADPGTGKTAFACAIAAAVSSGRTVCGLPVAIPGNVLMLSVEDDLGVLRGRIEANGGNLSRVHFLNSASNLKLDSPEIETAIRMFRAKLLIFDPLQAFLGSKVDMFRANETRPVLHRLFDMCARNDCACAIIAHMGKSVLGKSPVNQSLGSVDIPAAMRSVIQIVRNPDRDGECIAVHIKSSNAAMGISLAFSIGDKGGVRWHGFSNFTLADLSDRPRSQKTAIPYEHEPLVQVFNQLIAQRPAGGFWSYNDVKHTGERLLGRPLFESSSELLARLNDQFLKKLTLIDGLVVVAKQKQGGVRGIRIIPYQHPEMYQTSMDIDGMRTQPDEITSTGKIEQRFR